MLNTIEMTRVGAVVTNVEIARQQLAGDSEIGVDLETSGLHFKKAKVAVVSLHGKQSGTTAVIHTRGRRLADIPEMVDILERPDVTYVGHNAVSFDILFLAENGIKAFDQRWYDTMVGEGVVLTSGRRDVRVSLAATGKRRTGKQVKMEGIDHGGWMNPVLTDVQLEYSARDTMMLSKIKEEQETKASGTLANALALEMKLVPIVSKMTHFGLPIDLPGLYTFLRTQHTMRMKIDVQLKNFFEDNSLNLNSPIQIKKAFHRCGLDLDSTAEPVLTEVVRYGGRNGKLCEALLEYRHAATRLKNYRQDWINQHVIDGRVHPRFWQVGTDTGRFSSSDPNLQQVPKNMRHVFGNLDGYTIVSGDYSQIEVRVAAAIAEDEALINLIATGHHVHTALAAEIFGVSYTEVTEEQLGMAKNITFLMIFGGWVDKFFTYVSRAGSSLTFADCENIFHRFLSTFRGIDLMRKKAQVSARSGRPVTLFMASGLRRVLFGNSLTSTRILNTLVQGNAAAGLKFALPECKRRGLDKYLSITVHDELVSVVPDAEAKDYAVELEEAMIAGMKQMMAVPVSVKMKVGKVWQK